MFRHGFPLICLLLAHGSAAASTCIHTVDPQAYRDEAALYPAVGKVTGSGFGGSGVLISDRWVLTAGHTAFLKTGNGIFTVAGVDHRVESAILHPGYGFPANPYDLGLLYLSTPVTGVASAPMIMLGGADAILGREATYVGFGLGGNGLTGASGGVELRAFTNIIDVRGPAYGLTETAFICDFDHPDGTGNASQSEARATRLEGNVAGGDSGGGVFVTVDGAAYLVGISSFTGGFEPGMNSRYGSISGATNLELFHSWIEQQTGIAAVPEPAVGWLAALGALASWRRRR